jgi:hypothetical protein
MFAALLVCGGLVVLGLGMIFARDFFWGLTEFGDQTRGVESERTDVWDTTQVISGVILIGIGIVGCLFIFGENQEHQELADNATATFTSRVAQVQQYGTPLATLQTVEGKTLHRLSGETLGLESSGVFYGRCENGSFYAYIFDPQFSYKAIGYVPDSTLYNCHPDGVNVSQVTDLGDGWYEFWSSSNPDRIMTDVARMHALKTPENVLKMFDKSTPTPSFTPQPTLSPTPSMPRTTPEVRVAVATAALTPESTSAP